MGHILVAHDGSEAGAKALFHASSMMEPLDEMIVVYVIPSVGLQEFAEIDASETIQSANEIVNKAIGELRAKNIKVIGIVTRGDVADEIVKIGSEMNCDLIVLGYRGVSKVGPFKLGNVAEKVTKTAKRPVLVVR
ncbi:MAG: universal stress protein [Thermoplasmata archaeon]